MKKISLFFKILLLAQLLFTISACSGGGSSGTGTISIQGTLRTSDNKPLAFAKVNIAGSDEPVLTDSQGVFILNVSAEEGEDGVIPLEIESMGTVSEVDLSTAALSSSNTTISIEIKLDNEDQLIVANQVEVQAKIVGTCDFYFENLSTIRQSNLVPQGVNCTLKVSIQADGLPLRDVPFVLEYTGCSETGPWNLLAAGETSSVLVPGDGELEFQFFDDSEKCTYRVIAPYNLLGVKPVFTKIHTFTKQEYDRTVERDQ